MKNARGMLKRGIMRENRRKEVGRQWRCNEIEIARYIVCLNDSSMDG